MKNITRILVAFAVFLSGVALVPFVGLPADQLNWQRYAGVYTPTELISNYYTGSPGSFFTLTGFNFPANEMVTIMTNGVVLGTVSSDEAGGFLFLLDTTGADPGTYIVTASVNGIQSAVRLWLLTDEPEREQEDTGPVLMVPEGIGHAFEIYLPVLYNNPEQ